MASMHDSSSRYGRLMAALMTLIAPVILYKGIFIITTFRASKSIRPPDFEKMISTIFFCFEAIHEIRKAYFFLLHSFTLYIIFCNHYCKFITLTQLYSHENKLTFCEKKA